MRRVTRGRRCGGCWRDASPAPFARLPKCAKWRILLSNLAHIEVSMPLTARERIAANPGAVGPATPAGDLSLPLEARLADGLGNVLGVGRTSDEITLARTDRKALAATLLRTLTEKAGAEPLLAPADVYRVIPRRTWIRRKAEGGLTGAEFDGLYRLVRLQLLANLVFQDSRRANEWLHSPKARLGAVAPMDFAADSLGCEAVESWLHEIDQGYFA